jgi:hypothetical protein
MPLTRAKRLKLQHEAERPNEIVIDPIEVIQEPLLQDLIFQHLKGSDVKNLFTVSKTWNQSASESSKAMSKIKLKVDEGQLRPKSIPFKDIGMLLKSNRRYQYASFCFEDKTNIDRKLLLLERFSPSLVDLEYFRYSETANSTFSSELHFPKLEKLYIVTDSEQQTIAILQGATVLKELDLGQSSMVMLKSVSSSLTTLKVRVCSKEQFEYILESFPNLRKFHVREFSFIEISKSNNQTITEFSFGIRCYSKPLPNNIVSSMKNLEIIKCIVCNEPHLRMILTEGKLLKRVNINSWMKNRQNLSPNEVYETLMASDPTIPRNIVITIGNR